MKKLTNLILGLTFISSSLFSQEFLPEKFRDYKEKGKELFPEGVPLINSSNLLYKIRLWDVDQDSLEDVVEFYLVTGYSSKGLKTLSNPRYYYFDLNENHIPEQDEWLLDEKMDGLNGNEELIYYKPKKLKLTKAKV